MGRCNAIPKMEICIKFHIGFSLVSFFGNGNVCEDNEKEQEWERKRPLANIEHLVSHFISLKFICEPVCRHSKALDARWMLIFIILISLRIILQFCVSCFAFFSFYCCCCCASWNSCTVNSHLFFFFFSFFVVAAVWLSQMKIINSKHNGICFSFRLIFLLFWTISRNYKWIK